MEKNFLKNKLKKPPGGGFFSCEYYARCTFVAFKPFGDSSVSKETVSPSLSSSKVTPTRELLLKNRSFASPSAVMKPKPLSVSLFIVPVIDFLVRLLNYKVFYEIDSFLYPFRA